MLTPQDLQGVYFEKARFGGYSMQSVDAFLEPLMNDYVTIYKENTVLKSKMRLLVERLEAYRGKEAEMRQAIADTQKTCDDMIAQAERRCAELAASAEVKAQPQPQAVPVVDTTAQDKLRELTENVQAYIGAAEEGIRQQQACLDMLKNLSVDVPAEPEPAPAVNKAYDFDSEADEPPMIVPEPQPVPDMPDAQEDIATEIEQSVEKIMENVPTPPEEMAKTKVMPAVDFGREDKFSDLQFGKNYDPTL